ncbi:MAG: pyridoxal phosphate-dependent aminotransferase [Rubrivivax sp.]|nr:pyridoxal phosphate-dependent aminotransferase [Rubrivivax sp.]
MRTAARVDRIEPFYVMELAKEAFAIAASAECDPARGGQPMVFLNIGEPDFGAPDAALAAAARVVAGRTLPYTQATGIAPLRQAIARWYGTRFGLAVAPERIVVTAGASAGLQLACLALFQAGDEVLLPDPSYPCNRHFVAAADATARLIPAGPAQRFQLSAEDVARHWSPATRGVLLASPGNPTGTSIAPQVMGAIVEEVRRRGGVTLVDEIYLGLSYDARFGASALAHDPAGEHLLSINSFSKYFSMTGWRLGWLVLPQALVPAVERLAQNLYICPSTLAQEAALACFEPAALAQCEQRRGELQRRRDFIVPALDSLGLRVPVVPDGAFYAWADCSAHDPSSWDFCRRMTRQAHVALTPGRDFGPAAAERYLRLSYAGSMDELRTAVDRLARELGSSIPRFSAPARAPTS